MPSRARRRVILMLVVGLMASACDGGGSTAEYFSELEAATGRLDTELDAVEAEFNAGLLDIDFQVASAEAQLIDLFQSSITRTADSFAVLVAELRVLEPPPEAADSHAATVEAGERVLSAYAERSEQLAAIIDLTGIDEYAQSIASAGVRARFLESCQELQVLADREEVSVDLGC